MSGLSWRARRRWSLVILLVGMPIYVIVAVSVVELFDRQGFLLELAVFVVLGILWILPFRFVFRGVGRTETEADGAAGPADRR